MGVDMSKQETIYSASQLVSGVANVLVDYADCNVRIDAFEVFELVSRLDAAVHLLRSANGA